MNNEIKRIVIDEGHYNENTYPFTIKPNFRTLGSIIEISPQGPIISFMFDDSIRNLLGFNARTLYEEYTISNNPVDILSFDNIFLECNIAQGLIFRVENQKYFIILLRMLILVINTLKNFEVEFNGI